VNSRSTLGNYAITLRTRSAACAIIIETGQLAKLGETVRAHVADTNKALLVIDDAIASTHGETAWRSLEHADFAAQTCTIRALESNKTLATVELLYTAMLDAGLERTSPVIALGGGIVCDIAGFAAATFQRGVPIVMAPTTLLAMVDASIGGKNGVNFGSGLRAMGSGPNSGASGPQPAAHSSQPFLKNIVGTIWQPRAIVIDPAVLATLPERHVRCGLAECIKVAMLRDESLLPMITEAPGWVEANDWPRVNELIARCAAIKSSIVAQDEREDEASGDGRALLNLGHTFAHAFELIEPLELLHGEAVAIGLCAAASVARRTGRIDDAHEKKWRRIIEGVGLPAQLPASVPVAKLLDLMRRDKKVRLGKHRLVLPITTGAELVNDVPESVIVEALIEIGATA
jgi:3-dehydroquinate synthase